MQPGTAFNKAIDTSAAVVSQNGFGVGKVFAGFLLHMDSGFGHITQSKGLKEADCFANRYETMPESCVRFRTKKWVLCKNEPQVFLQNIHLQ
jgi:hypothetical protein